MDEATLIALDRALEWGARQQPPWSIEAVIAKASLLRGFLDEPNLTDQLWDRMVGLEETVHQLETELHSLGEFSPKPNGTRSGRNRGRGSSPGGPAETTTTQPDPDAIDLTGDFTPVDF